MATEIRYKPKLNKKVDDLTLTNWVWESMRAGKSWKEQNIDNKVTEHLNAFNQMPYGNEQDGRSKFIDATVKNYCNSVVVNLLEPFTNTNDFIKMVSNVTSKETADQAKLEEALLNYQFNKKIDKYNLLDESIKLIVTQGILATRAYWDFKVKDILADSMYEEDEKAEYKSLTLDELAEVMLFHKRKDEKPVDLKYNDDETLVDVSFIYTDIISENPTYTNVPIANMFWNPTAEKISYVRHDFDYVGEVKLMTSSSIRQKLKNDPTYKKFSSEEMDALFAKKDLTEITSSYTDQTEMVGKFNKYYDELMSSFAEKAGDKQAVIEIHGWFDIDKDGMDELIHIEILNDKIIKCQLNTMPDNMIPYNVALFDKTPFSTYGQSIPEFLSDIQKLKTAIMRNMQDTLAYGTLQNYIVEDNMFDKSNFKRFMARKPGDIIKAKVNVRKGGRLADKIANIPSEPIKRENFEVYQILEQQSQENSGIPAYTQGLDSSSLNHTATGASIINSMGEKRLLKYLTGVAENFMKPTVEAMRVYNHEYLNVQTFSTFGGDAMTVTGEDIDLDSDISINVAVKGYNAQKTTEMIQWLGLAQAQLQMGGVTQPEVRGVNLELMELWDLQNVASTVDPSQAAPMVQAPEQHNPGSPENTLNDSQMSEPGVTTINNV